VGVKPVGVRVPFSASSIRHRTLLVFSIGFASGIAGASFVELSWIVGAVLCGVSLIALCLSSRALPVAVLIAGFALGALRMATFFPPGWNIESYVSPAPVTIVGTVVSDPKFSAHKVFLLVATQSIDTRNDKLLVRGTTAVLIHGAALDTFQDVRMGDRVQLAGLLQKIFPTTNPGEYDWRNHLIDRGVSGELVVQRPSGARVVEVGGLTTTLEHWSSIVERRFTRQLSDLLPADESALLFGILFGDRRGITSEQEHAFAATGTSHILATAGLHIGILSIVLSTALSVCPISRKTSAVIIILSLWAFACLAGLHPPVVRAVVTATIYFGGRIFERAADISTTLAAAALSILSFQPTALFESDFQLSFVTVAGLGLLMPHWDGLWKNKVEIIPNRLVRSMTRLTLELAGLTLIAQVCSVPLTIYYYNQVSLLSLPVNLIVVPALFILIPAAILVLLLSLVFPSAATAGAHVVLNPLLSLILHVVLWFASLPFSSVAVAQPSALLVSAIYLLAYGAVLLLRPLKRGQHLSASAGAVS
jgi:competence protein ComEC